MEDNPQDPGALGLLLLATCVQAAPGLPWRWSVEPHPENCDCLSDHVNGMVTSYRFVTADLARIRALLDVFDKKLKQWRQT